MATLLGEWGFLNNLNDTSGNSRHASLTVGTPTYVTGPHANTRGLKFSSANDVITIPRAGLQPATLGITIMGWVKFEGSAASTGPLGILSIARTGTSTRGRIGIQNTTTARSGQNVARWQNDLQLESFGSWSDDNWHHLAMVDGDTRWAFYLDGVPFNNGARAFTGPNPNWEPFDWLIGRNATITDVFAHPQMSVSGLRIFQGELTTAEIITWRDTPIAAAPPSTPVSAGLSGGGALAAATTPRSAAAAALTATGTLDAHTVPLATTTPALDGAGTLHAAAHQLADAPTYPDAIFTVPAENNTVAGKTETTLVAVRAETSTVAAKPERNWT